MIPFEQVVIADQKWGVVSVRRDWWDELLTAYDNALPLVVHIAVHAVT